MIRARTVTAKFAVLSLVLLSAPFVLGGPQAEAQNCDPNYLPCIPFTVGDALNCDDIRVAVRVIGSDHNRFDRNNNGTGCESYGTPPARPAAPQPLAQRSPATPAQATQPVATSAGPTAAAPAGQTAQAAAPICDPNYRPCVPYTTGDALNCNQISGTVTVIGDDHNKFDRDGDGIGCNDSQTGPAAPAAQTASTTPATTGSTTTGSAASTSAVSQPSPTAPQPVLANTGLGEPKTAMAGLWLVGFGSVVLGMVHNNRSARMRARSGAAATDGLCELPLR